jgi:hypothetical protein
LGEGQPFSSCIFFGPDWAWGEVGGRGGLVELVEFSLVQPDGAPGGWSSPASGGGKVFCLGKPGFGWESSRWLGNLRKHRGRYGLPSGFGLSIGEPWRRGTPGSYPAFYVRLELPLQRSHTFPFIWNFPLMMNGTGALWFKSGCFLGLGLAGRVNFLFKTKQGCSICGTTWPWPTLHEDGLRGFRKLLWVFRVWT